MEIFPYNLSSSVTCPRALDERLPPGPNGWRLGARATRHQSPDVWLTELYQHYQCLFSALSWLIYRTHGYIADSIYKDSDSRYVRATRKVAGGRFCPLKWVYKVLASTCLPFPTTDSSRCSAWKWPSFLRYLRRGPYYNFMWPSISNLTETSFQLSSHQNGHMIRLRTLISL